MKKILVFILLLFVSFNVCAFSSWSEEIPIEKKNIIIETEVRYKWYKDTILEVYDLYGAYDEEYIDYNDTILTELSDWSYESQYLPFREIESKSEIVNPDTSIIDSIRIFYFGRVVLDSFIMTEFEVFEKSTGKPIKFEITEKTPEQIEIKDLDKLADGIYDEDAYDTLFNSEFFLMLDGFYNINDVQLIVYYKSNNSENKYFFVQYMHDGRLNISRTIIDLYADTSLLENGYDFVAIDRSKGQWTLNTEFTVKSYRFRDTLFKYYLPHKEYAEGYYTNLEDYIKDDSSAKVFYRYKILEPVIETKTIYEEVIVPIEEIIYKELIVPKEEIIYKEVEILQTEEESSILGNISNQKLAYNTNSEVEEKNNLIISIYIIVSFISIMILYIIIKIIVEKRRLNK